MPLLQLGILQVLISVIGHRTANQEDGVQPDTETGGGRGVGGGGGGGLLWARGGVAGLNGLVSSLLYFISMGGFLPSA